MDDQRQEKLTHENATLRKQLADLAVEVENSRRKLEVEAALDNVRLRAGAMRSSSELGETSAVLFQQMNGLGINAIRTAVGIFDDPHEAMELWLTSYADSGEITRILYYFNLHIHPVFENIIPARQQNKPYALTILSGNEVRSYYQTMSTYLEVPQQQVFNETEYFYSFFFSDGTINVVTNRPLTDDQCKTMIRVSQVFGLIFTRFVDLQKAEKSARDAQIESALERVRAAAQAMQQPEEMKDVIQVFRQEMGALGEEELETCHIFVHNEKTRRSECWFALKFSQAGEEKLLSQEFELDLQDTWVGREILQFYVSEAKETSIVMTGDSRREWLHYCEARCEAIRGYYGEDVAERSYHLYRFSNGAIGQSSPGVISQESWDLLKRTASVFSLAYSRFRDLAQARKDLQNLKEEKTKAENALMELKAAQRQLIQSEKMASLGELTAGIAHEIQNPLNFVNNFSEINKELLDELQRERSRVSERNDQVEDDIIANIKENEEKIIHHGKRADAIVKGMLQHSGKSSGRKELIAINALCDEYLPLAYHALRARNNSFHASIKTDFHREVGKINVTPQDIGRVILNLLANAFYAVHDKQKSAGDSYEPMIKISTKKSVDRVFVSVSDNGDGIPTNIVDKIFQPFFTTKPTGQGTGLGLSLAYDIVKAHGGEITVVTKEGQGSEFIVQLPIR